MHGEHALASECSVDWLAFRVALRCAPPQDGIQRVREEALTVLEDVEMQASPPAWGVVAPWVVAPDLLVHVLAPHLETLLEGGHAHCCGDVGALSHWAEDSVLPLVAFPTLVERLADLHVHAFCFCCGIGGVGAAPSRVVSGVRSHMVPCAEVHRVGGTRHGVGSGEALFAAGAVGRLDVAAGLGVVHTLRCSWGAAGDCAAGGHGAHCFAAESHWGARSHVVAEHHWDCT